MSFRMKIVLMTTILIAILFSTGGAVFVHTTFQASLQKEEQAAVDNNELILRTVQLVGERGEWFSENELISVINNICSQDAIDCLQLISEEEEIYMYQKGDTFANAVNKVKNLEENQVWVSYFMTGKGTKYLQTSTRFLLNEKIYYFTMVRNLSYIYEVRSEQINVFQKIFSVLFLVGGVFSWILATFLTRSLRKLAVASAEIGAGNLSYRTKIQSNDEIGALSKEFNRMAEKLEENITMLKDSAEQKDMFMGAFTHELKTPMTSIIGYSDLIRTQKLSEDDTAEALEYIFLEAKRLENLSLKMLDLFVADKKELVLKECEPSQITCYVVRHLQHTYENSRISFEVYTESGTCMLEPDLFQTMLINLLDNAKKAMEKGGRIQITVKMTELGCEVSVADQGKGIPKESIKHVTEAFYRVDKARARSMGSAGLGLALCEKIVQLHNGSISFESQQGIGTTVMIQLNGGRNEKKE